MSISLFVIGIILGGLGTLICVIFAIISLATGKGQNAAAWAVGFVIAVIVLVLSIFQFVKRVSEKVKHGVEWIEQQNSHYNDGQDLDDSEYAKQERQNFLDTLKKYTNPALADKIPVDYYANKKAEKNEEGQYILPFVFPLSIRYDGSDYQGEIISDVNDSVYLSHITDMNFDENFVIAKVDNTGDDKLLKEGRGEVEYILFDLRTREFLNFVSRETLIDKATKIGYTGQTYMSPLRDLYKGWTDSLNSDY
ncbi:MAG: hypothetical protein ACJ77K_07935 [Bacteroidia bacterium]